MLYLISCYRTSILIECDSMNSRLARSIVRRKYPIRFILKPIRFQCFG